MKRSHAVCLVVASLALASPAPARAQAGAAATGQREKFESAQKLFDARDYAAALPLFKALHAESGSPNARLYVARCLRELGRLAEAYDEMKATVREATQRADAEPKYAPTRDGAAAELALLEPRVGHVVVAVADAPAGSIVLLDGSPVSEANLGTPITVMPGKVMVEATPPSGASVTRELIVGGGETRTVALALKAGPASAPPGPVDPEPDAGGGGGGLRTVGFVGVGVGVASLAVFAITGSMANGKFSTVEEECGGVRCSDPKYGDVIDSGKSLETIANITLVAGAALTVAGAALIVFGGPSDASGAASVATVPGGGMLRYHRAF